jgi:hypothetical protein
MRAELDTSLSATRVLQRPMRDGPRVLRPETPPFVRCPSVASEWLLGTIGSSGLPAFGDTNGRARSVERSGAPLGGLARRAERRIRSRWSLWWRDSAAGCRIEASERRHAERRLGVRSATRLSSHNARPERLDGCQPARSPSAGRGQARQFQRATLASVDSGAAAHAVLEHLRQCPGAVPQPDAYNISEGRRLRLGAQVVRRQVSLRVVRRSAVRQSRAPAALDPALGRALDSGPLRALLCEP